MMIELDDFTFKAIAEIGEKKAVMIEERIKILLQDKPKWLPLNAWRKLIARFIIIEVERIK